MYAFEETPKKSGICSNCGRPMPRSVTGDLCSSCKDAMLYREVKEYLLHHEVTELELAEHFNIPLQQVRSWISDGRIDYKPRS